MSEHEHKWMVVSTPTEYICECGVSAFDDGRGISPVPPQQTPQNIDWEKEFDENWPTLYGPLTVGALESGYDVRNELKSFIRSKKKEWDEEASKKGFNDGEQSMAKAVLRREHIYPNDPKQTCNHILLMCKATLSQGETKEEKL